jgi:hypothetical protein
MERSLRQVDPTVHWPTPPKFPTLCQPSASVVEVPVLCYDIASGCHSWFARRSVMRAVAYHVSTTILSGREIMVLNSEDKPGCFFLSR